jgi:hypothetical protein
MAIRSLTVNLQSLATKTQLPDKKRALSVADEKRENVYEAKNLARIHKQGTLNKQSSKGDGKVQSLFKTWQPRWFVFSDEGLSYYGSFEEYVEGQREMGFLPLDCNFRINLVDGKDSNGGRRFRFCGGEEPLEVEAATDTEVRVWEKTYRKVCDLFVQEGKTPVRNIKSSTNVHLRSLVEDAGSFLLLNGAPKSMKWTRGYFVLFTDRLEIRGSRDEPSRTKPKAVCLLAHESALAGPFGSPNTILLTQYDPSKPDEKCVLKFDSKSADCVWLEALQSLISSKVAFPDGYVRQESEKLPSTSKSQAAKAAAFSSGSSGKKDAKDKGPKDKSQGNGDDAQQLRALLNITPTSTARQRAKQDNFRQYAEKITCEENVRFYIAVESFKAKEGLYRLEVCAMIYY